MGDPIQLAFLLLAQVESFREKSYQDQGGTWTIGFGRTGPDVVSTSTTGLLPETEWTKQRLQWLWQRIDHDLGRDLNANQAAAVLSFAYNVGLGALERSTLWHFLQEGQWLPAAEQFGRYDKVRLPSGLLETSKGLIVRRKAERALFLSTLK